MDIYDHRDNRIFDVPITNDAEHEEELMKSDLVRLSWNAVTGDPLPVDSYIIPFDDGVRYRLFEPYTPEQKSEAEWRYNPEFQHPKMYLGKVPFTRSSYDTQSNPITLLEWSYTGFIGTLLQYFCDAINEALGLSGDGNIFEFVMVGEFDNIISTSFSAQDILSALSNVAGILDCEYHLDWSQRTLYFGHIEIDRAEIETPVLEVDVNVGVPSVRNSKEGYWNAYEPQGSTRNMSVRAASGESVQANVRLALDKTKYPDGIIYTDGKGNVLTKAQFEAQGLTPYLKSVIYENVYPRLDLFVYDVRGRERYLLDEDGNKVVDHYDGSTPVYKRYTVWFMRLAYPTYNTDGTVGKWNDFTVGDSTVGDSLGVALDISGVTQVTVNAPDGSDYQAMIETKTTPASGVEFPISNATFELGGKQYTGTIERANGSAGKIRILFGERYATAAEARNSDLAKEIDGRLSGNSRIYVIGSAAKRFHDSMQEQSGTDTSCVIIDGKTLMGAFQANTRDGAETSPLAGQGDGDGDGHYGFELTYHEKGETIPAGKDGDGDTGVQVKAGDFEIVIQQNDDLIIPTTQSMGMIPKGKSTPSLLGNIVNLYNIVLDDSYIASAQSELESEALKTIAHDSEDNNTYTLNSNPVVFEKNKPVLYIGRKVVYRNGDYELPTRVMKLVTKLDYDFEQEITVGNEILKGNQTTMREKVDTLVTAFAQSNGGFSEAQIRRIIEYFVTPRFLSKLNADTARGVITFLQGLQVGGLFTSGILGEGGVFRRDADGKTYIEADKMYIRMRAYFDNVEIRDYQHTSGNRIASQARGFTASRVEWLDTNGDVLERTDGNLPSVTRFRVYWRAKDDEHETQNQFIVGDQAFSDYSDVTDGSLVTRRYWRVVVGRNVSLTDDGEAWVDLSNKKSDTISYTDHQGVSRTKTVDGYEQGSSIPEAEDDICQLGNVWDTERQGAVIEYVGGENAPSYQIYQGIDSFSLNGKNYVSLGYNSQTGRAYMNVYGDAYIGDPNGSTYINYHIVNGQPTLDIKAVINAQSTIGNKSLSQYIKENQNNFDPTSILNAIDGLQDQVDNQIETWYGSGEPTGGNDPLRDLSDAEKEKHVGDLYYDRNTNHAYRYMNNGTAQSPVYVWEELQDTDVSKALGLAGEKRRIFVSQPTASDSYDVGDIWVNATYPANGSTYSNDILRCNTAKAKGDAFNISHWGLASKYTDDSGLNEFKLNEYVKQLTGGTITENITNATNEAKKALATANSAEAHAGLFDTIRQALNQGTLIDGGLVLSTLIGLRDSNNVMWSGISGAYNGSLFGGGLAAWYGGGNADAENKSQYPSESAWAKSAFRFDGSGYLAGGNISWTSSGQVTIRDLYTMIGNDATFHTRVLNQTTLFANLFHTSTTGTTVGTNTKILPQAAFQYINISRGTEALTANSVLTLGESDERYLRVSFFERLFQAYNGTKKVDANDNMAAIDSIKAMFGFWTEQYISALGKNDSSSSSGSASTLKDLLDVSLGTLSNGQVLKYNAQQGKWVNGTDEGVTSLAWSAITDKPTTLSGYGITDAKIANGTITIGGNSITPLTSQQSLSAYVTLNTAQTITGKKTFYNDLVFNDSLEVYGTSRLVGDVLIGGWSSGQPSSSTSSLRVNGTFECFGGTYMYHTLNMGGNNIDNVKALYMSGTLTVSGKSYLNGLDLNGNDISNVQSITVNGTARLYGDTVTNGVKPYETNKYTLGNSSKYYKNVYATSGTFASSVSIGDSVLSWDGTGKYLLLSTQLKSSVATGTAPFTVASTTLVRGLNADMLDDREAVNFVFWEGNPLKNNMNDIARSFYSATGMTQLASSAVDNGDMIGWTHFFNTSFANGDHGNNSWVFQMACPAGSSNLQFRSRDGGTVTNGTAWTTNWTKILHAGNIGSYNAGSATKLQTARTIWGQSFNGSANVSGTLTGVGNICTASAPASTIFMNNWYRSIGQTGWYNETYYGGIYMTDYTWVRTFNSRKFFTGNTDTDAIYTTGGVRADKGFYVGKASLLYSENETILRSRRETSTYAELVLNDDEQYACLQVWDNRALGSISIDGDGWVRLHNKNDGTRIDLTEDIDVYGGVLRCRNGMYSDTYVSALGQNTSSDIRRKDVTGNVKLSVDSIASAPMVRYTWRDNRSLGLQVGSIAQYWETVLPEAVHDGEDGYKTMQYGVIALLASISTARKVVDHERRIKELEKENERLRTEVEQLRIS